MKKWKCAFPWPGSFPSIERRLIFSKSTICCAIRGLRLVAEAGAEVDEERGEKVDLVVEVAYESAHEVEP